MDLEEAEEEGEVAGAEVEVFEEVEDGVGSGHEDRRVLRRLASVLTAERLCLIN